MVDLSLVQFAALFLLAFAGGTAGGATGFGMYLVLGPLAWIFLTPTEALAVSITAGIPMGVFLLYRLWPHILWRKAGLMLLYALPGLAVGAFLHTNVSERLLEAGASVAIVAAVGARLLRHKALPGPLAGVLSGAMTTSVGFNGPPLSLALQGRDQRQQRGTVSLGLVVLALLMSPVLLLSGEGSGSIGHGLVIGAFLSPATLVGVWVGDKMAGRLGQGIEKIAIGLSLFGAAWLLFGALY